MSETTEQVSKKVTPPKLRNPTGKGGFKDNPQNQSPGGWKKENTISYQYNRFINMDRDEFEAFNKLPAKDKTMAMILAYNRVAASAKSLNDLKEITDRTEGRAPQYVELKNSGEITHKFEELDDSELDRIIKARQDRIS